MAEYYQWLKVLHMSCAALSIALFLWRGAVLLATDERARQHWLRWLPHVVDSVLLASGISLAVIIHQYPGVDAWLTAKVIALVAYIVLGLIALRAATTRTARCLAFAAAVLTFAYIVGAAVAHNPLSWWTLLAA